MRTLNTFAKEDSFLNGLKMHIFFMLKEAQEHISYAPASTKITTKNAPFKLFQQSTTMLSKSLPCSTIFLGSGLFAREHKK